MSGLAVGSDANSAYRSCNFQRSKETNLLRISRADVERLHIARGGMS